MSDIRVRFAPSPTGYLHVGGARTALFNWLFARKMGGKFILRIEDTDLQRSSDEMVRGILEGLEWLGLDYDEGPFYQSDYAEKHRAAAFQLLDSGWAYRDFTPKRERADADIKQEIAKEKVVNPFRTLSKEDSDARAKAGELFVIRFKVPEEGQTQFEDAVFGLQERAYKDTEDLVLLRSDGHPLYNLSVTVDDIEMGITHVVRGQDHLSNTHKQVLIYQALGAKVPKFAHLPLILAPNKGKLSKRKHGEIVSVTTYRNRGFLPDAFVNFLALLGWSPAGIEGTQDQEIFSREKLIELFTLEGIHKANAVFNFTEGDVRNWTDQKALWMNFEYIKTWPLEKLLPYVKAELQSAELWRDEYEGERRGWYDHTLGLLRERTRTLKDFAAHGRPYFVDGVDFEFDEAAVKKNLQKDQALKTLLPELADAFAATTEFTHDGTEAALRSFAEAKGVKPGLLINATRTALTGQAVGPSLFEVVAAIGRARTVERLWHAASLI
ncbi:MAG: glutamate--tRNA ligase [Acidobacteria bacterium]|nr:glutamate--tRNA ligase [Acidobacteriota bacterium]MBI3422836.1 glutamate--tRNA ligase [Acidobacteriota bacterium]